MHNITCALPHIARNELPPQGHNPAHTQHPHTHSHHPASTLSDDDTSTACVPSSCKRGGCSFEKNHYKPTRCIGIGRLSSQLSYSLSNTNHSSRTDVRACPCSGRSPTTSRSPRYASCCRSRTCRFGTCCFRSCQCGTCSCSQGCCSQSACRGSCTNLRC